MIHLAIEVDELDSHKEQHITKWVFDPVSMHAVPWMPLEDDDKLSRNGFTWKRHELKLNDKGITTDTTEFDASYKL